METHWLIICISLGIILLVVLVFGIYYFIRFQFGFRRKNKGEVLSPDTSRSVIIIVPEVELGVVVAGVRNEEPRPIVQIATVSDESLIRNSYFDYAQELRRITNFNVVVPPARRSAIPDEKFQDDEFTFPGHGIVNSRTIEDVSANAREEYKRKTEEKLIRFRNIQKQLLLKPRRQVLGQRGSPLLICVDARPTQIGGYCINFIDKICYSYTFKTSILPWNLHDKTIRGDASEFEMKNLLFALLLWEDQIKVIKKVEIHTDNYAIERQTAYGLRVKQYIEHLKKCEGVETNDDFHVHSETDPEGFVKYILPADDLSRWRIGECEDFIRKFYKIDKFESTHKLTKTMNPRAKPFYEENTGGLYQYYIDTVNAQIEKWRKNTCHKCGFILQQTASLRQCRPPRKF